MSYRNKRLLRLLLPMVIPDNDAQQGSPRGMLVDQERSMDATNITSGLELLIIVRKLVVFKDSRAVHDAKLAINKELRIKSGFWKNLLHKGCPERVGPFL